MTNLPSPTQPYLCYLQMERRYAAYAVRNYTQALERFAQWLSNERNEDILNLTNTDLRSFIIEAQRDLSRRSLHLAISAIRGFYKYALQQKWIKINPVQGLILPKLKKSLPVFLSQNQILALLEAPQKLLNEGQIDAFIAKRDRAIMEVLYGGGLRISELIGLAWGSIDWSSGASKSTRQRPKRTHSSSRLYSAKALARFER